MRKKIVAGNWKMNKTFPEAKELANAISSKLTEQGSTDCDVVIFPPYPFIGSMVDITNSSVMSVGAQNCSEHDSGAYTGEISLSMLESVGAKYVILGHSERREYFGEDNALLKDKVEKVLEAGLTPVFCCGESLEIRDTGHHEEFVKQQISDSTFNLSPEDFSKVVIAYEPIWAIGTGVTASSQQAQDMHKSIRETVATKYGSNIAENLTILYGGSCKPGNAKELFSCPDVDGGLIGGASLKVDDFVAIINSF